MRRTLSFLAAMVVGMVIAGASPPAIAASAQQDPQGSVAVRLLEGPSNRADDPRASQYVIDHLQPGDHIKRRFAVDNHGANDIDVQLYAAAATVHDGAFHFADGREGNDLTSWMTVDPPTVHVPGKGSVVANLSIAVPATGVGGGERYAVVWAELPSAATASGVTLVNRVGIRVYLSVGGAAEPPTHFTLDTFTPVRSVDGKPGIEISACNDGARAVDLAGSVRLSDGPGGTSAGPFESQGTTTLAPKDCAPLFVPVPDALPRGPWRARATLHSGKTEQIAEATVTFPAAGGARGKPVPAKRVTSSGIGRLLILLAALLVLLLAAIIALMIRRRRQAKAPHASGSRR
jgi:hypothetical protein